MTKLSLLCFLNSDFIRNFAIQKTAAFVQDGSNVAWPCSKDSSLSLPLPLGCFDGGSGGSVSGGELYTGILSMRGVAVYQ